jgi:chromosome segregation ATPase
MVTRKLTLAQLASVGEGAIGRLAQNPVTHKAVEGALQLKERVEKLVTGFESLEQRMTAVEQRLDSLEKSKRTTTKKTTTARKTTTAARKTTPPPSSPPSA